MADEKCPDCKGEGIVYIYDPVYDDVMELECPKCGGTGNKKQ